MAHRVLLLFIFFFLLGSLHTKAIEVSTLSTVLKHMDPSSFSEMIDNQIMSQHTLSRHQPGSPYFKTDSRDTISELITSVVEKPDGVQMDKEKGTIQLYKDFRDIQTYFLKEPRKEGGFDGRYLGEGEKGPTNRVIVVLDMDPSKATSYKSAYPF
jgi:hypothetical protein